MLSYADYFRIDDKWRGMKIKVKENGGIFTEGIVLGSKRF